MSSDIVIIRDGDAYRLLYGHLHLASELNLSDEVLVDVKDEGTVRIVKSPAGLLVGSDEERLPLRFY